MEIEMVDCKKLLGEYRQLQAEREGNYRSLWEMARKFVYPKSLNLREYAVAQGSLKNADVFDDTAILSRAKLSAGILSWMTPPDQKWASLAIGGNFQDKSVINEYFQNVSQKILDAINNSNFYGAFNDCLNEMNTGLDGVCYTEEDDLGKPIFKCIAIENIIYTEDKFGNVNKIFKNYRLTRAQFIEKFQDFSHLVSENKSEVEIVHAVCNRKKYNVEKIDDLNMPWASYEIMVEGEILLKESGYNNMPYAVLYHNKPAGELHGTGPGIDSLPNIKMLNKMRKCYLMMLEREASPSWMVPNGSVVGDLNLRAGAVNVYNPANNGDKPTPINYNGNIQQLFRDIQEERLNIREAFYSSVFDPLESLKNITATEAEIRNEGKITAFAPIAGNIYEKFLKPIILRVYEILGRNGYLEDVPNDLDNKEFNITFHGKIALNSKRVEGYSFVSTMNALAPLIERKPELMDNYNEDKIVRDVTIAMGNNASWLNAERTVKKIRDNRANTIQQQQQQQMMLEAAGKVGNLTKEIQPNSPLDALVNAGE